MANGLFGLPWLAWTGFSLVTAVVYYFVWPKYAVKEVSSGLRFLIVRYGHSLTWVLIAVNFLLRGRSPALDETAYTVALAGGITYLFFLMMTFLLK